MSFMAFRLIVLDYSESQNHLHWASLVLAFLNDNNTRLFDVDLHIHLIGPAYYCF